MGKNYYGVLGLAQNATDDDIRRRFRKLARERHPDRFQGAAKLRAEQDFQVLTEAFNVLTDPERRRVHDADLSRAGSPRGVGAAGDQSQLVKSFLARGVQVYKQGDYDAARESFERATQVDPESAQGWYNLALTCSRQERWLSRALGAVEKACELEPMKPAYLKLAGRLFARAGRPDRARRYLEEALTWGGSDAEVEAELDGLRGPQKGRRGFFGKAT